MITIYICSKCGGSENIVYYGTPSFKCTRCAAEEAPRSTAAKDAQTLAEIDFLRSENTRLQAQIDDLSAVVEQLTEKANRTLPILYKSQFPMTLV